MKPKIVKCNEKRLYWSKSGQIPFKAEVTLIAKIYFPTRYRMGFLNGMGKCIMLR